jgi:hypothetical protein
LIDIENSVNSNETENPPQLRESAEDRLNGSTALSRQLQCQLVLERSFEEHIVQEDTTEELVIPHFNVVPDITASCRISVVVHSETWI